MQIADNELQIYYPLLQLFAFLSLLAKLPGFYCVNGIDEHDNAQNKAVFYPEYQYEFYDHKQYLRETETLIVRQKKARTANENIAHRVNNRIALVTKREGSFAITLNNKGRVLDHLPQ